MKRITPLIAIIALIASSCSQSQKPEATVSVANSTDAAITAHMIEVPMASLSEPLRRANALCVTGPQGEVPCQVTHDSLLIFQVSVEPLATANYTIKAIDSTKAVDTIATGRLYPERQDDMCWENDLVGFRAYGPGSQQRGERLYGYDLWLKRGTSLPVIESFVAADHNPAVWAAVDSLRGAGQEAEALALIDSVSYHIDHGYGMDCYAVGPTLGACTSALLAADGSILYPWAFDKAEVLDCGPLRFSMLLTYPPMAVGNDTIVETRLITLDAGSNLNTTTVSYAGNSAMLPAVTGIVLHDDGAILADSSTATMAYTDPTQGDNSGKIFIGAVFAQAPDSIAVATEASGQRQLLAYHAPSAQPLTYRWGFGWDRGNIGSWEQWTALLATESKLISNPLTITITY